MSQCRITDKSALTTSLVWALLRYPDGSEFCFQTTLCPSILREYEVTLEEGKLVRLDKKYYWDGDFIYRQFPFEGAKITLWNGLTYTDEESYRLSAFL